MASLDEEDGNVVADDIPVAVLGVHFDGEAAHIAGGIGGAAEACDGREAHEDRGLHARILKHVGDGEIGQRFVDLEVAVGGGAARVNDAFGNAFVVEVLEFFAQNEVFEKGRAALPGAERVLVGADRLTDVGGEARFVVGGDMREVSVFIGEGGSRRLCLPRFGVRHGCFRFYRVGGGSCSVHSASAGRGVDVWNEISSNGPLYAPACFSSLLLWKYRPKDREEAALQERWSGKQGFYGTPLNTIYTILYILYFVGRNTDVIKGNAFTANIDGTS